MGDEGVRNQAQRIRIIMFRQRTSQSHETAPSCVRATRIDPRRPVGVASICLVLNHHRLVKRLASRQRNRRELGIPTQRDQIRLERYQGLIGKFRASKAVVGRVVERYRDEMSDDRQTDRGACEPIPAFGIVWPRFGFGEGGGGAGSCVHRG